MTGSCKPAHKFNVLEREPDHLPVPSNYVQLVRARFVDQSERYIKFCHEVTTSPELNGKKLVISDASMDKIKAVLGGHEDLIPGLYPFLKNFLQGCVSLLMVFGERNVANVCVEVFALYDEECSSEVCVDNSYVMPFNPCRLLVSPVQVCDSFDTKSHGLDEENVSADLNTTHVQSYFCVDTKYGEEIEGNCSLMEEEEEKGSEWFSFLMTGFEEKDVALGDLLTFPEIINARCW